jgi:hypothetical protein
MADKAPTKHETAATEMLGAYDERTRTFNALRNPHGDPERRRAEIAAYNAANKAFEAAKANALKLEA